MGKTDIVLRHAGWCILRTGGPRTLPLLKSLGSAGVEAWSPVEMVRRRRARSKVEVRVEAPIMPTFVFARARHLPELSRCLAMPRNPHPSFSIFHHDGRIPLIADRDIVGLRDAEEKARVAVLKTRRHVFPRGSAVRVPEGSFAGMSGIVEGGDGKSALVCFGGRFRVSIATFLLETDGLMAVSAHMGAAA